MINSSFVAASMNIVSVFLYIVGSFGWSWAIYVVLTSRVKKFIYLSPRPILIRVLLFLSLKYVLMVILVSAFYSLARLLDEDDSQVEVLGVSMLAGVFLSFILGPKGLVMPLGHGLSMTIDKAPRLGGSLSKYVINFHADEKLGTARAKITALIVETITSIHGSHGNYDFVLKSWIFASHGKSEDPKVLLLRKCLRWLRPVFASIPVLLVVAAVLVDMKSHAGVRIFGMWLGLLGPIIALMSSITLLLYSERLIVTLIGNRERQHTGAKMLAEKISKKIEGFDVRYIGITPIPKIHLLSMSVTKPKVVNGFFGEEAGIIFVRQKMV